jgi:hypothetical protein
VIDNGVNAMSTAELITSAANAKRLTPLKIAAEMQDRGAQCTARSVENWMGGAFLPHPRQIAALCDVLELDANEFLASCAAPAKAAV